jgi:hypothetical protein
VKRVPADSSCIVPEGRLFHASWIASSSPPARSAGRDRVGERAKDVQLERRSDRPDPAGVEEMDRLAVGTSGVQARMAGEPF